MHRWFGVKIVLPDLGEGTKEATIKEWFVKEGDLIKEFDDLCEVYTDKLVAKIPSTSDGKIGKINFTIDETCLVGSVLLEIDEESKEVEVAQIDDAVESDTDHVITQ
jgi:2-oxoisovalerate dehydrogenase E2 component (dihydrolipoyl transacylase)